MDGHEVQSVVVVARLHCQRLLCQGYGNVQVAVMQEGLDS